MSRVDFEPATAGHDAALRRLLAANSMEGDIELAFEREPSYFHGSEVQAPFHQVVIGRDTGTGEVVGVGTRAVRPGYVNGRVEEVGYLADLRLDPRYRGGRIVARAYRHLAELHADGRVRLYFTMIAEGNTRALQTIASGRAGLPPYRDLGRFLSPAVNLRGRRPDLAGRGLEILRGMPSLLPQILDCLQRNHARRQLAPHYRAEDFHPVSAGNGTAASRWLRGFALEDFYVARREGAVVGVVGKWDQSAFKQTVIRAYRRRLRLLRPLFNLAAPFLAAPRYPPAGCALRSFYASFIAVDDDEVTVLKALLRRLYNDALGGRYHYFVVGLHERDPLAAALDDYAVTPFAGRLFAVHFADGAQAFNQLEDRVPYVELAML